MPENNEGVVWKKRSDAGRFLKGRDGDMLLNPFQCDLCWFRNLKGRNPNLERLEDKALMSCVRRVNLDMLWSCSPSTVAATMSNVKKGVRMCEELGINPTYAPLGPWRVKDEVGFTVALQMVKASLNPGKYQAYQQFDTIRGIRTAFSNIFEASLGAHVKREVLRGVKGIV